MIPRFAAFAALPLLAVAAHAQTTAVYPSDHASVPGSRSDNRLPFANGISRTQMIYESWDLRIPAGDQITAVGFRQDDARTSTGRGVQVEIWMGGTDVGAQAMSGTFANNLQNGTPLQKVFGPSIVQLPDLNGAGTQTEFFVELTTPYTVQAGENLVVEYRVFANSNANQAFNYYLDAADFLTTETRFGQGCQSSAGTTPQLAGVPSNSYLGGSMQLRLTQAPANSLVWFNLGAAPSSPVDLAAFGAPGCTALVFPQVNVGRTGSVSGTANLDVPLPDDSALAGASLYSQVLVFDLFANNLGFVASNGVEMQLGIRPTMSACFATGSTNAASGSVRRRGGPIALFRHQ